MQTEARVGVAVDGGVRKLVQQQPPPQQIGTISQLLAGGVAGALSKTCTAPLARLTILFQVPNLYPLLFFLIYFISYFFFLLKLIVFVLCFLILCFSCSHELSDIKREVY